MDERLGFVAKLLDGESMTDVCRELLVRRLDQDLRIPAKSTIHAVLHRHGLVKTIGRARHRATGATLSPGAAPNDLWCADFKGEFKLG